MSEDRTLMVYAEHRSLSVDDDQRALLTYREGRAFLVDDEDRVLEVRLP